MNNGSVELFYYCAIPLGVLWLIYGSYWVIKRKKWAKQKCRNWVEKQDGTVISIEEHWHCFHKEYSYTTYWEDKDGIIREMFLPRKCWRTMKFNPEERKIRE